MTSMPAEPLTSAAGARAADTADPAAVPEAGISASLAAAVRRSAEIERRIENEPHSFRILTGDRPTGELHLGHYFGTLHNRVRLKDAGAELFVLIADYQVLTDRDVADRLGGHVLGLILDYLAIGVDPARSVIFAHSAVPELSQLLLPFLSLVTHGRAAAEPHGEGRDKAAVSRGNDPPDRPGHARWKGESIGHAQASIGERADAHLPGAPGRRHPGAQREP